MCTEKKKTFFVNYPFIRSFHFSWKDFVFLLIIFSSSAVWEAFLSYNISNGFFGQWCCTVMGVSKLTLCDRTLILIGVISPRPLFLVIAISQKPYKIFTNCFHQIVRLLLRMICFTLTEGIIRHLMGVISLWKFKINDMLG